MDFGIEEDSEEVYKPCYEDDDLKRFLANTSQFYKSKAAFFADVRSGIRQGLWNKHKVKLEVKKTLRRKIKNPNPNPRKGAEFVWGCECNICHGEFRENECEVDHIVGEASLKDMDDLVMFFKKIVMVTPQDLQIVCKQCHAIKTYSERYGVSFNEAKATKAAKAAVDNNTYQSELTRLGVTKLIPKGKAREILANLYLQEIEKGVFNG